MEAVDWDSTWGDYTNSQKVHLRNVAFEAKRTASDGPPCTSRLLRRLETIRYREASFTAKVMNPTIAGSSRRSYLGWLMGLCTAGVGAFLALPVVRFTMYPLRTRTAETNWSDVGPISDFSSLAAPIQRSITVEQVDGWRKIVSEKIVYVAKDSSSKLQVLSAVCPHLGCSVQWRDSKHQFGCPCHGAEFSPSGVKKAGPAPRGMDALQSKIEKGRLLVKYEYFRQLVPTKEVIG